MEITEVRITLKDEFKLRAYASITLDNCFVIRGLKVINGPNGYFVSMPCRRRRDGSFQDLAHPINNEMRMLIENTVLDAFEDAANGQQARPAGAPDVSADESVESDVETNSMLETDPA